MKNSNFSFMKTIKKRKPKFEAGKPRYCQNCGKESHNLIQVTTDSKVIDQKYLCEDCSSDQSALK